MDRCLKDKAHFIISQTIWNNKNGKAVFAEQVFDRCAKKFQDEINRELYKLIEEGGGGQGKDGKTPVLTAGDAKPLPSGSVPTVDVVYTGNDAQGNPIYRIDLGIPAGKDGTDGNDGNDGDDGITPELRLTEQGIEVSYNNGATWSLLVPIDKFTVTNNIINNYINNADEEDITVVDDKLKFANKTYDANQFSGLGRVYLRKNIVGGKNVLTQSMINTANTIYVIQYDYDLNGITISIPENCILQFDGGSLSNGTITFNKTHITDGKFINIIPLGNINNTIAYAKWFESEDDTKVIHWLFTIAANNVQIELENKTYNIDTTNPNGYANGFIKIDNCNSFIINGNGAKIYDIIEYDTIDDKLYEFIRFTNCSYVNINNITYEWKYEAEIVDKVKGIIFIRTLGECKNFYLNFEVINVGRGLYSGSFNNTNIGRGFCDSIVKVKATKVGYPIAIEIGDNNDLFSTYENVHRGNYYCGLSNSKVHVKGKNPVGTSCHVLLSDGATTTDYLHCKNVDIIVEDTGSTNTNVFCVLVQTYSSTIAPHLADRTENYNISFNAKVFVPEHTTSVIEPIVWVGANEHRENVNFNMDITILSNNENNRFVRLDHDNYRPIATVTGYIKYITNSFIGVLKEDERLDFYDVKGEELRIWFTSSENKQGIVRFIDCNNAMFAAADSNYKVYPTVYKYNSKVRYGTNQLIDVINEEAPTTLDGLNINSTANQIIIKSDTDNTYINLSEIILGNFQSVDIIFIPTVDTTISFASTMKLMGGIRNYMRLKADKYYNFKLIRIEGIYCIFAPIYDTDIANIGTTTNRPTLTNRDVGFIYWDTNMNKPFWWNGISWITYPDSSGSTMAELTFTGAVEATYNGSTPVTVNIPTGGGGGGEDGKTPVMQIGNVTTVAAGGNATADVRADGADPSGNPIYKVDFGIPRGSNGIDGDDGVSAGFGEPTASAEAVASDVAPSVVVTATGTNTSKIFDFAFKIPKGINGTNGDNGLTPTIGENGNWMIGAVDTGVKAKGEDGLAGKTPVFETGEVVTGAAGTAAIVTVVLNGVDEGGNPKYLINFTIPRGADGTGGGGGTDRGRCVFTLEDYSAAYRPEIGLSKILPAISGFALNDCVIDVTGSVRQVTAVSEDKQTANLSDVIYTFPTDGGTGGVTEARVTEMINAVVGDINTILDNINGEVI